MDLHPHEIRADESSSLVKPHDDRNDHADHPEDQEQRFHPPQTPPLRPVRAVRPGALGPDGSTATRVVHQVASRPRGCLARSAGRTGPGSPPRPSSPRCALSLGRCPGPLRSPYGGREPSPVVAGPTGRPTAGGSSPVPPRPPPSSVWVIMTLCIRLGGRHVDALRIGRRAVSATLREGSLRGSSRCSRPPVEQPLRGRSPWGAGPAHP